MLHPRYQQYGVLGPHERPCPVRFAGFHACVLNRPAEKTGGDFYFVASPRQGRATVVIGDACGKGAQAAEWVRRVTWQARRICGADQGPSAVLTRLNAVASGRLPDHGFITATCVELDVLARTMTVSNAAHVPPVLSSATGPRVAGRASGPPLGIDANARYRDEVFALTEDDVVVLMTDGVLEPFETDLANMSTTLRMLTAVQHATPERIGRELLDRATSAARRPDDRLVVTLAVDEASWRATRAVDQAS